MTTTTITRDGQEPITIQHEVPFEDIVQGSEQGGFRALDCYQSEAHGGEVYQGWKWADDQQTHILVTHMEKGVK